MNKKQIVGSGPLFTALLVGALVAGCAHSTHTANRGEVGGPRVSWDSEGQLKRPEGWRQWVYVGTPVTPNDMNGGKAPFPEFHNVYIDPESYAAYESTGLFPDGTTLVKELASVGTKSAVSGQGYFPGEFIGLEVALKSRSHHVDEPGNWAYYSFTSEGGGSLKNVAKAFPTTACNACHQAAAADDWVFTQYYPVLRAAREGK